MSSFPDKSKVPALLAHLQEVLEQRVSYLRELANTYKIESTPCIIRSDTYVHITRASIGFEVWLRTGNKLWSAFNDWTVDEKASFVENYDRVATSYADDVNLAYVSMEKAQLWKP